MEVDPRFVELVVLGDPRTQPRPQFTTLVIIENSPPPFIGWRKTMSKLDELQAKRDADERFLSHREEQELLRLQAEEIVSLRDRCELAETRVRVLELAARRTSDILFDWAEAPTASRAGIRR